MKIDKNTGRNRYAAKRGTLVRILAARWVRAFRPDVYEACHKEAEKLFPLKKRGRKPHPLPESIARLKP